MAGMANWDSGTNETHSHTMAAFRRKRLPVLPLLQAPQSMEGNAGFQDSAWHKGVQQTVVSCCGPALCPRTLAATVPLLLWLEP